MKSLNQNDLLLVAGGCEDCHTATIDLLNSCSLSQIGMIHAIFKSVILSDELHDASEEAVKATLLNTVLSSEF